MKRLLLFSVIFVSSLPCYGAANCFAHTSVQYGPPNVSAPIDDTGATMLIAFTTTYAGYTTIKDVVGGPNTWYMVGNWGAGNATTGAISVFVAPNPITSTSASFKNAGGVTTGGSSSQIWACSGVNASDLFYASSGQLAGANSATIGAAIGTTDTTIPLRLIPDQPIQNGDYTIAQVGSQIEYMLVTDASLGQTQPGSIVVQRAVLGSTAYAWALNQGMHIGQGTAIPSCYPPAAISPSAAGDLEFVAAGRSGTNAPGTGATATINLPGFSTPVVIGGGPSGTVVMAWRVATDTSSFQPTLTMSASDQWGCVSLVIKASTSPSATETPPLVHTVVGNGYQCNNPGGSGSDCPQVAPGNGGPPNQATLNWPTELLWYKHGVPADKVMVFIDNQANLLRAVNFDTVPHTVANVVIQPGTIGILAGTGNQVIGGADGGCTGNNGPALNATMLHPAGVAEDPTTGNIAVADQQCASVDIVDTAGNFHWAVGGGPGGTKASGCGVQLRHGNSINVLATNALLICPQSSDYDANGNLIIGDAGNHRVVFVNLGSTIINAYGVTGIQPGYVVAIAGNAGVGCNASFTPKIAVGTALEPLGIYVDRSTGDVYVGSAYCFQAFKVTADGHVVLLAGTDFSVTCGGCEPVAKIPGGYSADGTAANGASFQYIFKVILGVDHLVHFTDTSNNLIRHIDAQGNLVTDMGNFARWGPKASAIGGGWYGENGSALRFELNYPTGFNYDSQGNLCVASLINNVIPCIYGATAPTLTGGAFVAASMKWVGGTFITGSGIAAPAQPIYGGLGQPGATTATLSGNTVVLNDSASSVLLQLQNAPEAVGQSWTFTPVNQAIYLILFGGNRKFVDASGHTFAFNPPIAVSIGGVTMYMYQSTNALNGTFTAKITA